MNRFLEQYQTGDSEKLISYLNVTSIASWSEEAYELSNETYTLKYDCCANHYSIK